MVVLLAGAACLSSTALAQSDKPITMIVGYSAGGSADSVARICATALSTVLKRQVIVENVTGASGILAANKAVNGPVDGSVIYLGGSDTILTPMVNPHAKLDWEKALLPVGRVATSPLVFVVHKKSPYNNLSDLIAGLRKTEKASFNYAVPGLGTSQHVYAAVMSLRYKVSMTPIPYRGGAQIVSDLAGEQVDGAVLALSTALPFLKDGSIKALSISDAPRVAQLPQVKPISEEKEFTDVSLPIWQGLFLKAGTPPATVTAYEQALAQALENPELRKKLSDAGFAVAPLNGAELQTFMKSQASLYRGVVKTLKLTTE
ncbi:MULTISPECIES: Bug family tripartite tricarboxylate transporter substrate binding protein [unclassified Variovorax]|uniref:Bug family tripartite tricarboxylate transporter substrate binding protein n=1 Tax=unclassified Variovorax TaxID=663243 RepID=UPI003F483FC3